MRVDGFHVLEPFCERTVQNGMSYGVSYAGYDIRARETMRLPRNGFALLSSVERFRVPSDVIAFVHDKSTWARRGLSVFNTVIEPGWGLTGECYLTIEVVNNGYDDLMIEAGDPIAQVIFHRVDRPVPGYVGKYSSQPARPVSAIEETA